MAIWFGFYENGPFNPKKFDKENENWRNLNISRTKTTFKLKYNDP